MKPTPAAINKTAFSCPHCGAYTTQYWYELKATPILGEVKTPSLFTPEEAFHIVEKLRPEDEKIAKHVITAGSGEICALHFKEGTKCSIEVSNLHISKCYNCNKFSVWAYDKLIHPNSDFEHTPNPDLPEDVKSDFIEASKIVKSSPRGAAALLRLCIQKICIHLGEKGKSIDADIRNLTNKGLSPLVQKSLDIVRVVGNESVHPGIMDLKDNYETASQLFELVNIIADQLISQPMRIESLYGDLPESKRKAIEDRNK